MTRRQRLRWLLWNGFAAIYITAMAHNGFAQQPFRVTLEAQAGNPPPNGAVFTLTSGPMTVQCRFLAGKCIAEFPSKPVNNFVLITDDLGGEKGLYWVDVPAVQPQPKRRAVKR